MWLRILEYFSGVRKRRLALRRIFLRKVTPPKILIVRNDGLGDFILTLPIIAAIKFALPHARIHVLAARPLHSLAPLLPEIDGWVLDPGCLLKRHRAGKSTLQLKTEYTNLVREVAAYRFDLAIFSYAEGASARLIAEAGVPYRLGSLRRSFFYQFNLWYYLARRKSGQSEFQLNLKILRALPLPNQYRFPRVEIPALSTKVARGRYVVMHPYKRSGTALVWPIQNFQELARYFLKAKMRVIAIGDTGDLDILSRHFGDIANVEIRCDLTLVQTAALLRGAVHFFGNSSGPLHLAALVQTPHTGFYPQNRIAAPRRWRTLPFAATPPMAEHLLSTQFPKDCIECELKRCAFYPCTEKISVESAINSMRSWKKLRKSPPQTRKTARTKYRLHRRKRKR
ncbi:MAG: glycosyltransferase family 9 protein [Spirochaetes bacterium]|nr:glycosyltransferase family 9 protein [Spirochaetota bacterium]